MLRSLFAIFLTITIISPLWPLGPNPLPGDPFIIVNKRSNQLAFISDNTVQYVKPVATGKERSLTPEGLFTVIVKAENPYYRKLNIPGGSDENPLGTRWIGFDAENTDGRIYGIHGTNQPDSIRQYISQGCIRMHNEDVEQLFEEVPIGMKVLIINSENSFEQIGKQYGAIE